MAKQSRIQLSRLRELGWANWDPIRLGGSPQDEYDTYLLKVAGMVRRNEPDKTAIDYLVWVESEYMGLGMHADTRQRAQATIEAIRSGTLLWSEPQTDDHSRR
jgi:hypothetical protein